MPPDHPVAEYPCRPVSLLVDLQQIAVRRVDRVLFEDLSLAVSDGDRIGVVGVNGDGKVHPAAGHRGGGPARRGSGPAGSRLAGGVPRPGTSTATGDGEGGSGGGLGGRGRTRPSRNGRSGRRWTCRSSPGARPRGWRWPECWPTRPSSSCSMSPPTISTWGQWPGSSSASWRSAGVWSW